MKKQFLICLLQVTVLLLCVTASAQKAPVRVVGRFPHQVALRHPGMPSNKPMTYTLYQTRNQKGFPTGYTMVVDSVICMEKTCQVINVKMVWDALGGYLSYELEKGKFLEKGVPLDKSKALLVKAASYKGVPFTDADYRKLDHILRDDRSLLSTQRLSDLSVVSDNANIDGVTGATPKAMKKAVVEGASLTCFQLWHWANGEIVETAKELTHLSCSKDLLHSFLLSEKPRFVLFALEHLARHKQFSPSFVKAVNKVMRRGDHDRIKPSLAYLKEAVPQAKYYDNLAVMFNNAASEELREAQMLTLSLKNTGMAVPSDIGNVLDIHPKNKLDVGKRLALWALAKDYGKKDIVYSGPIYKSMKIEGDKIRVSFDYTGSGLKTMDGKEISHLIIAGADKKFVTAKGVIEGSTVVVSSDAVKKPVAVRYGWSNMAEPNLANKEGLPASSFRTDD